MDSSVMDSSVEAGTPRHGPVGEEDALLSAEAGGAPAGTAGAEPRGLAGLAGLTASAPPSALRKHRSARF